MFRRADHLITKCVLNGLCDGDCGHKDWEELHDALVIEAARWTQRQEESDNSFVDFEKIAHLLLANVRARRLTHLTSKSLRWACNRVRNLSTPREPIDSNYTVRDSALHGLQRAQAKDTAVELVRETVATLLQAMSKQTWAYFSLLDRRTSMEVNAKNRRGIGEFKNVYLGPTASLANLADRSEKSIRGSQRAVAKQLADAWSYVSVTENDGVNKDPVVGFLERVARRVGQRESNPFIVSTADESISQCDANLNAVVTSLMAEWNGTLENPHKYQYGAVADALNRVMPLINEHGTTWASYALREFYQLQHENPEIADVTALKLCEWLGFLGSDFSKVTSRPPGDVLNYLLSKEVVSEEVAAVYAWPRGFKKKDGTRAPYPGELKTIEEVVDDAEKNVRTDPVEFRREVLRRCLHDPDLRFCCIGLIVGQDFNELRRDWAKHILAAPIQWSDSELATVQGRINEWHDWVLEGHRVVNNPGFDSDLEHEMSEPSSVPDAFLLLQHWQRGQAALPLQSLSYDKPDEHVVIAARYTVVLDHIHGECKAFVEARNQQR